MDHLRLPDPIMVVPLRPPPCGCDPDEGPCEAHCEVLAQREGASCRTADELCLVFISDAREIDPEILSPYGQEVYLSAMEALNDETSSSRWLEDPDLADALREVCNQVESHLADLWIRWDDGYTIARVTGGPLKEGI